jgi:hypothetical protein
MSGSFEKRRGSRPHPPDPAGIAETRQQSVAWTMPHYAVRHLAGQSEELSCLVQLEDECAAMYFNIIHGAKVRRRFTTKNLGMRCKEYLLVARDFRATGLMVEREIALFDLTSSITSIG